MGLLMIILGSMLARLMAEEALALGKLLGKWIIVKSVERLPEEERDRFREEWLAHLNDIENLLGRLLHALSCAIRVERLKAELTNKENVSLFSVAVRMEQPIKADKIQLVTRLDVFARRTVNALRLLKRTSEQSFSISHMASSVLPIVVVISVLIRPAPEFISTETHYNRPVDSGVKIEAQVSNRADASIPSIARPITPFMPSNSVSGTVLLSNLYETATRASHRANTGLPWDTSINPITAAPLSVINSNASLAGNPVIGNGMPMPPNITAFTTNANSVTASLSSESPLLTRSVPPLGSQTTFNGGLYLSSAVLTVATSTVPNILMPLGAPEVNLSVGTHPWVQASDPLNFISRQLAGATPALNNSGLLGISTAIINVTELAGDSDFPMRTLTRMNELISIQQTALVPNYFNLPDGRYVTSPAAERGYLTPAAFMSGTTPGLLAMNQAMSASRDMSIIEPAFIAGGECT
jgi:hypothetical protein